ncbi:MAG: hypothetical protein PVF13_02350, partial [Chromatiales bacterium]
MRRTLTGLTPQKLRLALALFFIALALPTAVLVYQAYSQLKWEAFHQHRVMAEELANRIRAQAAELIAQQEARRFADYAFLVVAGDPATNYVERSSLSSYPLTSELPGILGYFQVDAAGTFSTPLLPATATDAAAFGVSADELRQRRQLAQRIQSILSRNRLVRTAEGEADAVPSATLGRRAAMPRSDDAGSLFSSRSYALPQSLDEAESQAAGQAAFDQLSQAPAVRREVEKAKTPTALGRVEDLQLEQHFATQRVQERTDAKRMRQSEESPAR